MKLCEEIFGEKMSNAQLLKALENKSRVFDGKFGQVMNLGAHDYNTAKGTFKFSGRVLRVDRDGVFTLNGKVIDVARIPKKKGRIYLVSKICAVYAKRDDFVFVNKGLQNGKNRYLFTF